MTEETETTSVTKRTLRAPVERDSNGLTLVERKLLQEIAMTGSWQQAADSLGLTKRQVQGLFRKPAFKQEYDDLFNTDEIAATKRELEMVATGTGKLYEEALNAEMIKQVHATCPKCNYTFKVWVTVMDWASKLRAGETLLKITKILTDNKKVQVEGTVGVVNVHLTTGEYLALERLKMGFPVPDHIYRRLTELGRQGNFEVPALPSGGQVVEGEVHEISTPTE